MPSRKMGYWSNDLDNHLSSAKVEQGYLGKYRTDKDQSITSRSKSSTTKRNVKISLAKVNLPEYDNETPS